MKIALEGGKDMIGVINNIINGERYIKISFNKTIWYNYSSYCLAF